MDIHKTFKLREHKKEKGLTLTRFSEPSVITPNKQQNLLVKLQRGFHKLRKVNIDKPQYFTQENAVGLHRVGIVTREESLGKHIEPVKNTDLYHCRTFSPLLTIC